MALFGNYRVRWMAANHYWLEYFVHAKLFRYFATIQTLSSQQETKCKKTCDCATTGWRHIRSIHSCNCCSRYRINFASNRPSKHDTKMYATQRNDTSYENAISPLNSFSVIRIVHSVHNIPSRVSHKQFLQFALPSYAKLNDWAKFTNS